MEIDLLRHVSYVFAIVLSLPIHEFSHGYVAKLLGDDSAQKSGRLTINPMSHIDPVGLVCMLLFGYGWARAVPININKFSNPKRDMALVGLAGPVSNLMLALVAMLLSKLCLFLPCFQINFFVNVVILLRNFMVVNVGLAIFNLIPIPPLDGSRFLMQFLSNRLYYAVLFLERFGSFFVLAMVWSRKFNFIITVGVVQVLKIMDFMTISFGLFHF